MGEQDFTLDLLKNQNGECNFMGLFNKFKKESKKKESIDDSVPEKMIKPPEIKPTNTIKKEQLENELLSLIHI